MLKLRDRSLYWLYQRISAGLLAVFLWLHFHLFVRRFIATGGIEYNDLMVRLSNPVFKVLEITFVFLAITHGFYGVWTIIETFIQRSTYKRFLYFLLWTSGILLFLFITAMILLL